MSQMDDFEERGARRAHGGPYTDKHQVPTVQGYRQHRDEIKERQHATEEAQNEEDGGEGAGDESKARRAYASVKAIAKDEDQPRAGGEHDAYPTGNRNAPEPPSGEDGADRQQQQQQQQHQHQHQQQQQKSATETAAAAISPKEKRKIMKKQSRGNDGGREVTDPVTHLPITVRDMTNKDLDSTPENEPTAGTHHRSMTGVKSASKSQDDLGKEKQELDSGHEGMRKLFPPPDWADTKREMMRTYRLALGVGIAAAGVLVGVGVVLASLLMSGGRQQSDGWFGKNESKRGWPWHWLFALVILSATAAAGFFLIQGTTFWLSKKVDDIFEDETWDAAGVEETDRNQSGAEPPESAAWLNSLLASVWPLINPDLFSSLVDMLEDVMQASLPKVVRMVSVDDIGQGSEAVRILGVKWLPTGAASQPVDAEGKLRKKEKNNDRTVEGEGETDTRANNNDQSGGQQQQESVEEGMEGEEGDFINMELAFAYRARSSGKSIASKARNAHLYLKFYLPGGICVPVWVELRGLVGIMRLRLQLTPDPPFFELCTLTFLGQPRADLSCTPLSKHSLNVMDLPLVSGFVQSAIDAALAEYVAPKSLTLNLKDMLIGEDFKRDTVTRGVVLVYIKRARGFKHGDGGLQVGGMDVVKGSSDSYVTVSWGKFGKPVFCTRIIVDEQEPVFNEWASILVSPDEINAEETLRIQLWDSDKHTADDDLGRTEVKLKELMHGERTKNKMCDREDELRAEDPDEKMPGQLSWSVGYFSKAHIQQCQLEKQTMDPSLRSLDDMKNRVRENAKDKLREANWSKDESKELHQQEAQDHKELEDSLAMAAPPPDGLRSGILGIQIHNITGLEVVRLNRNRAHGAGDGEDREDEAEQSDDLPDSYCIVVLNHKQIYRTRTKPKNAKPFFNAGTERFVKDWTTAEVIVAVRDSREGENDPLLGVVYLPLRRAFADGKSQVMMTYPLAGGVGYGRARISLIWRSVELKMDKELRGWDYGTLEVKGGVKASFILGVEDNGLKQCKLKFKTKIGKAKMYPCSQGSPYDEQEEEGRVAHVWKPKERHHPDKRADSNEQNTGSVFTGVTKRYATPLIVEFRDKSLMSDSTPAIAVLWLSAIPDEEERTVTVKVWKGGKKQLKRARSCADYEGLEEGEQPLGEMELTVRLWRGLSGYHKRYAGKGENKDIKGVMEVLDTVNDEKMAEEEDDEEEDDNYSDSSSSSSDDDSDYYDSDGGLQTKRGSKEEAEKRKMLRKAGDSGSDSEGGYDDDKDNSKKTKPVNRLPSKMKKSASSLLGGKSGEGGDDDGERGPLAQVQDYKKHRKQLHRKHRGVMQWKAARTLDWMGDKVKDGKGKVEGLFEHGEKGRGVETEV
ncbi:hypothetical protein B0T17DRAFT_543812 [Bombardia bombarda]|uniref:Uncharacterized protein n=1 Tax=Bombardia bombarda TaxID=252184 RepID=A0AA39WBK8_9PEZI|nr:hypothetical protein B0T17DRAFT_543812 [Bombardia bombarda]